MKAWRIAAATTVCWPRGTWANALRMKWTRQRCQVAPMTIDRQQAIDPISRGDGARRRRRGDRTLQALVAVGDDELHAFQATADEFLEEARPEGLGLALQGLLALSPSEIGSMASWPSMDRCAGR